MAMLKQVATHSELLQVRPLMYVLTGGVTVGMTMACIGAAPLLDPGAEKDPINLSLLRVGWMVWLLVLLLLYGLSTAVVVLRLCWNPTMVCDDKHGLVRKPTETGELLGSDLYTASVWFQRVPLKLMHDAVVTAGMSFVMVYVGSFRVGAQVWKLFGEELDLNNIHASDLRLGFFLWILMCVVCWGLVSLLVGFLILARLKRTARRGLRETAEKHEHEGHTLDEIDIDEIGRDGRVVRHNSAPPRAASGSSDDEDSNLL